MKRLICIALSAVAAIVIGLPVASAGTNPGERVCFPADEWAGNDANRPCSQVRKVWEDGSTRIRVTDADGDLRYVAEVGP